MHSVHDPAIGGEDDRETQIRCIHQTHMLDDRLPCRRFVIGMKRLIQLADRGQWNLNPRKVFAQRNKPIDVPCQKPAIGLPKVILLSHSIAVLVLVLVLRYAFIDSGQWTPLLHHGRASATLGVRCWVLDVRRSSSFPTLTLQHSITPSLPRGRGRGRERGVSVDPQPRLIATNVTALGSPSPCFTFRRKVAPTD